MVSFLPMMGRYKFHKHIEWSCMFRGYTHLPLHLTTARAPCSIQRLAFDNMTFPSWQTLSFMTEPREYS